MLVQSDGEHCGDGDDDEAVDTGRGYPGVRRCSNSPVMAGSLRLGIVCKASPSLRSVRVVVPRRSLSPPGEPTNRDGYS